VQRSPEVAALVQEQQSLLSQRRFEQAYEALARVEKAKKVAAREHRLQTEVARAHQAADLKRRQRVERAEVACSAEELEHELRFLRARRLFELGGPAQRAPVAEPAAPAPQFGHSPWPPGGSTQWREASPWPQHDMQWSGAQEHWAGQEQAWLAMPPGGELALWPPSLGVVHPHHHLSMSGTPVPMYALPAPDAPPMWPSGPAVMLVAPLPLVPIPSGWGAPAAHHWAPRAVADEAAPWSQAPAQGEDVPAVYHQWGDAPAPPSPDRRQHIPQRAAEGAAMVGAAPPMAADDCAAQVMRPVTDPAPATIQPLRQLPPALPEHLSDDSSDGGSSVSDTSSLGGAFQELSANVAQHPAEEDSGAQPPTRDLALQKPAPQAAKTSAPQSSLGAVLAARRASETAALAASAARREFTTSDFRQLFSLCRHGKYRQVKDLLVAGCPVDGRDHFGNTPLIVACQNGHARIVKALLRSGANVQAFNRSGNTGLHYACSFGFTVLADFLISQGANDAVRNLAGLTPYEGIK
jgi:hypothetical protein